MFINQRIITFLTLAETLNYTRTAQRLNLSQPAVTKHIQSLEEATQTPLVDYRNKQVHLTDKGQELVPYLEGLLKLNNLTMRTIHKKSQHTQVRLGVCLTLGNYFINDVIELFSEKYPNIELSVYIKNTKELEKMLEKRSIDLALILGPTSRLSSVARTLHEESMIFIAAEDHPLVDQPLSIHDLKAETIFLREEGAGTLDVFQLYLTKRGLTFADFDALTTVGSIELTKQLVIKNKGIAPIYQLSVRDELKNGTLKKLNIQDLNISYPVTILIPKNYIQTDSMKILINYITEFNRKN